MNDFTASNGSVLSIKDGWLHVDINPDGKRIVLGESTFTFNDVATRALREFFQAEADERLGRWRWPHDSDVFVRPIEGDADYVEVYDESSGEDTAFRRSTMDAEGAGDWYLTRAARAYFDAHPEPKPWHKAGVGEIWMVDGAPYAVMEHASGPNTFVDPFSRAPEFSVTNRGIRAARIIWPEVAS